MARPYLELTKLQRLLVFDMIRNQGYSEGVHALYQRLKRVFGGMIHPAMNDEGEIAYKPDGEVYELETRDETSYEYNGDKYEYETREMTKKGVKKRERRLLLPNRKSIEIFLRKDPSHQIDRPVRHAVAGGIKSPPKYAIKPVIPNARVFDIVFCDSMRMPKTISLDDGAEYSWCFVMVDALTKMIFVKPLQLQTKLSTTTKKRQKITEDESEEQFIPKNRPASDQTYKFFLEFIKRINKTRKHHDPTRRDVFPRLVVSDRGSEFMGPWTKGLNELKNKYKKTKTNGEDTFPYFNYTKTPLGRSQYNSLAESAVGICRRAFYRINRSYQEQLEKRTGKKKRWVPEDWHVDTQSVDLYDWTQDCDEVMRRLNSRYHSTTKTTPISALLEIGISHKQVKQNIVEVAEKRYKDVKHNLNLPGFSPSSPVTVGDYVRVKIAKIGDMGVTFHQKGSTTKKATKSASNNWSINIYKVVDMKVLNKGQRTYRVENIDPNSSKRVQGFLTRVQVLKVPPDTVLDSGRTVKNEEIYYKTEDEEVDPEDEKEEEEVELTVQQKANKLIQYTKREWNQELRGKKFKSDDKTLEKITNVVYRGMIYKWVIEYESEDKSEWEDYLPVVLSMAKNEDWYKPEYDLILNNKKFRIKNQEKEVGKTG